MKTRVYIDGFNLYYGLCSQLGQGSKGWKWLDLVKLSQVYATKEPKWSGAKIDLVTYFTARVNNPDKPQESSRQYFYLQTLKQSDVNIVYGKFTSWARDFSLSEDKVKTKAPKTLFYDKLISFPSEIRIHKTPNNTLLATVVKREEKGSDVNLATHLTKDVFTGAIDAAIVISNDSDLALPIKEARQVIPVGLINPQKARMAGSLGFSPNEGVGSHWSTRLDPSLVMQCQFPDPYGQLKKPLTW